MSATNETKLTPKQLRLAADYSEWCHLYQSKPEAGSVEDFRDFLSQVYGKARRYEFSEDDCNAALCYFTGGAR